MNDQFCRQLPVIFLELFGQYFAVSGTQPIHSCLYNRYKSMWRMQTCSFGHTPVDYVFYLRMPICTGLKVIPGIEICSGCRIFYTSELVYLVGMVTINCFSGYHYSVSPWHLPLLISGHMFYWLSLFFSLILRENCQIVVYLSKDTIIIIIQINEAETVCIILYRYAR